MNCELRVASRKLRAEEARNFLAAGEGAGATELGLWHEGRGAEMDVLAGQNREG